MQKLKINRKYSIIKSKTRCNFFRKKILEISQKVSAIHIGGAFSVIEIIDFVYFALMRYRNKKMLDTFILSKGHSVIAQYVVLQYLNILKKKDIVNYCTSKGRLGAHPDYGNPGIEASTGSLGHGMSMAVGMAYSDKINKNKNITFLVISDGELQEGSTWEGLVMASNLKINNLICFLDHNGSQSFAVTKESHPNFYPIKKKIVSFGWACVEVDGHDQKELSSSIKFIKNDRPLMVICNTVKGKGVSFMENKPIWHYRSPNNKEFKQALIELSK